MSTIDDWLLITDDIYTDNLRHSVFLKQQLILEFSEKLGRSAKQIYDYFHLFGFPL